MKKVIKKQAWLLGGLGLVAALPIAVAASCSSSSSTSVVDTSKILALKVDTTASTHDYVTWLAKPLNDIKASTSASYQYYDKPLADEKAAANLDASLWKNDIPTSVNPDVKMRALWVKILPKDGYSIDKPFLNLTPTSDIIKIKTSVDKLPEYSKLDLANFKLLGPVNAPSVSGDSGALPLGSKLVFKYDGINGVDYDTKELLVDAVKAVFASKGSVNVTDLQSITVRLEVTDPAAYVIAANMEHSVDVSAVQIDLLSSLPAQVYSVLNQYHVDLKATPAITNDAVKWVETPKLPSEFAASVTYLSGNYRTRDSFKDVSPASWKTTLAEITSVDSNRDARHLWAKITPAAGKSYSDVYYDITGTSNIQNVTTKVDTSALNLSTIKLTGSASDIKIDHNAVNLPTGVELEYSVDNKTWEPEAPFKEKIAALPLTETTKAAIKVRLAPMSTDYVITDAKMTMPDVTGIHITISPKVVADFVATIMVKAGVESTHDAIRWSDVTLPANDTVEKLEFLVGNYPTLKSTEGQTWVPNAIPTMSSYIASERHLWVHFVPYAGKVLNTEYQDLTEQSQIQSVKTKIDASSDYESVNLAMVILTGTPTSVEADTTSVKLPVGAMLEYAVDGTNFKSLAEFKQLIAATPLTEATKATIRARLAPTSSTSYILLDPKTKAPSVTGIIIGDAIPTAISAYVGTISAKTDDTSTHDAVLWNQGAFTPDSTVASLNYLIGDFKTENEAKNSKAWSSTIPNSASYDHDKRHLWVQYVPVNGKTLLTVYQDITTTSHIQAVKSKVDAGDVFKSLNFAEQVQVDSLEKGFKINTSLPNGLPTGTQLMFSWSQRSLSNQTATELMDYLVSNVNTLNLTRMAQIQAHLVKSPTFDNSKFILIGDKASSLNLSKVTTFGTVTNPISFFTTVDLGTNSVHSNLNWTIVTDQNSGAVKSYSYLVGNYATLELAKANTTGWSTTAAKTVNKIDSERHVWARITLEQGWSFVNADDAYVDLTEKSRIGTADVKISANTEYEAQLKNLVLSSSQVSISGSYNAKTINIDESALIALLPPIGPNAITIKYTVDGTMFYNKLEFFNFINAEVLAGRFSIGQFNSQTRFTIEPTNTSFYALTGFGNVAPTMSLTA